MEIRDISVKKFGLDLFNQARIRLKIQLKTPLRSNQKDYKPYPRIYSKTRKRLETLFSQLTDQFMMKRNYAKSFRGLRTRILSKITATTVIQFINHFLLGRNINALKHPIF